MWPFWIFIIFQQILSISSRSAADFPPSDDSINGGDGTGNFNFPISTNAPTDANSIKLSTVSSASDKVAGTFSDIENPLEILWKSEKPATASNIENLIRNTNQNVDDDANSANKKHIDIVPGVDHTKHIGLISQLLFNPFKDRFQQWTAFLTHPNVAVPLLIKKPAVFLQRLQEKGAHFLHTAQGVIFGPEDFTRYPFPYRKPDDDDSSSEQDSGNYVHNPK